MKKTRTSRRDFLKLGAAAAAAPWIWVPRKAFAAATPGFGTAKHVLVLYAKGGMRSHCTFNAVGTPDVNPFGVGAPLAGRDWAIGGAIGSDQIVTTTFGTLPSFAEISNDVTVLASVDHNPTGANDVDHRTASNRIATGEAEGVNGLLARLGKDLPLYANGFSTTAVPPVEISPTEFGFGQGDYAVTRPLSLLSAQGGFASDKPVGEGWKINARAALDARFKATRSRAYAFRLNNFLTSKHNVSIFAGMLEDPILNVISQPDTAVDGFTNAQLLEVLGSDMQLDANGGRSWGPDVAMALRFFHFGSPMAVVTRDMYDMHDNEKTLYATRMKDLVRQLAGLHYLLLNMPHPSGGTYWDHTIVSVVSEFSRNNTMADGFNSGAGSDHVTQNPGPQRNQALPIMGGPLAASKGKLIGSTDDQINATGTVFTSKSLLATYLDALGLDPQVMASYWPDAPISEIYA